LAVRGRDETVTVRVRGVSPLVDPQTGTATAELEVLREPGEPAVLLPPGMVGRVSFRVNERRGFSVPDYVLEYKGREPYLRLVEEGRVKKVAVALGRVQNGQVEVVKGLAEGAKVIERASRFVPEGEAVTVQQAEGADKG